MDDTYATLAAFRTLVVDDVASARWALKHHLLQLGFPAIEEAKNGKEALEKLRSGQYKLVLSDWKMSDMHGLELFKAMKADPALRGVLFVLITGSSDREGAETARKAGVAAYLTKPVSQQALRQKILELLAQKRG